MRGGARGVNSTNFSYKADPYGAENRKRGSSNLFPGCALATRSWSRSCATCSGDRSRGLSRMPRPWTAPGLCSSEHCLRQPRWALCLCSWIQASNSGMPCGIVQWRSGEALWRRSVQRVVGCLATHWCWLYDDRKPVNSASQPAGLAGLMSRITHHLMALNSECAFHMVL